MQALSEYFQMGGYAWFVWPAYALAAAGLIGVLWASYRAWRAREHEFAALKTRAEDAAPP
ncbi:MAG: heme exporter protein CcmD [Rhodospirillaceae bacterium]|nr:heme exporter protein CcmD [Rhodospirillaceae bacterium]